MPVAMPVPAPAFVLAILLSTAVSASIAPQKPPPALPRPALQHEPADVVRIGDGAYQMVRILGTSGAGVVFAFRPGLRQDGEFAGMWMTEAVWPVASGDLPAAAF